MPKQEISPRECIELHEILTFKNTCLTKSITMTPLVTDPELKTIMKQDAALTQDHIRQLKDILGEVNLEDNKNIKTDKNTLS